MLVAGFWKGLSQEAIVFLIAVAMFALFALLLPGFTDVGNLVSLVQSVALLAILGTAMAQVIIGRGVDLSMVAVMAISVAWSLQLTSNGMDINLALACGVALALAVGIINGILVAFLEIPTIFATLAMGSVVQGFGQSFLISRDVIFLPDDIGWLSVLSGSLLGLPASIIVAICVAALAWLVMRFTKAGVFAYAMGDNPAAARGTGIAVRPLMMLQYVICAGVAFVAGLIVATSVDTINTRISSSTLIYDVILVVVIGGVGLSGGKGGIRNVIVGTLLIGILLNGLTILNFSYTTQNIIKSLVLLVAIIADSIINPRDEQTSQQGDI
jgi:ribose transport system permease protein